MISTDYPYFSSKIQNEVIKICKPLFIHTPFTFFNYERYYFDGTMVTVNHMPDMSYEVYNQKLFPTLEELHQNTAHYGFLSTDLPLPKAINRPHVFKKNIEIAAQVNIKHRVCLIYNTSRYVEILVFGTSDQTNPIELFMQYNGILERFGVYFREVNTRIIMECEQSKFKFDLGNQTAKFNILTYKNEEINYQQFFSSLEIKKYRIRNDNYLSKRELECLLWSAKGKTAKEISRILSLSPRTVESYLMNLKNKLNCRSKEELIDVAHHNPLIKSFIV